MNAKILFLKTLFLMLTLFFVNDFSYAQQEISKTISNPDEYVADKSGLNLVVTWNPLKSNRTLTENVAPFGDTLGVRAKETGEWVQNFSIGVRTHFTPNFKLDFGIGYMSNKESYLFESTDSTYSYTNSYRYIGLPIKLVYQTKGEISFFVAGGVMPKGLINKRTVSRTELSTGVDSDLDIKTTKKVTPFLLDVVGDMGINLKTSAKTAFFAGIQARRQLTSTFDNQSDFIRKSWHLGMSFGITYSF